MTNSLYTQFNFSQGEVAETLINSVEEPNQSDALFLLRNMIVHHSGGIKRRDGTMLLHEIGSVGRIIALPFSDKRSGVIVLTEKIIYVFNDDKIITTFKSFYSPEQIMDISWTFIDKFVLFTHEDISPHLISYSKDESWNIVKKDFSPVIKFRGWENVQFSISSDVDDEGKIIYFINSDRSIFELQNLHGVFIFNVGDDVKDIYEVETVEYISPKQMKVNFISGENKVIDKTSNWREKVCSIARGFPIHTIVHQGRLVIGGTRDMPYRIFMSKTFELFNFEFGEGLDDDAMDLTLMSSTPLRINSMVSSLNLEILTSIGEWVIFGSPIKMDTVKIIKQTNVGTYNNSFIPPRHMEGATFFVGRNGKEIREMMLDDTGLKYVTRDIAKVANHLMNSPVDLDYNDLDQKIYIVMQDGSLAIVTYLKDSRKYAWSLHTCVGKFKSVCVVNQTVYVICEVDGRFFFEKFSADISVDHSVVCKNDNNFLITPKHLIGKDVIAYQDNTVLRVDKVNKIIDTTDTRKLNWIVGTPYTHTVAPMPYRYGPFKGLKYCRIIKFNAVVKDTNRISIDLGNGYKNVYVDNNIINTDKSITQNNAVRTIEINSIGWTHNMEIPLWKIQGDDPVNFHLIGISFHSNLQFN
ncbi:MAG: hypothetical protein JJV93_02725 [Alphaproteobacteria bacterium]|nr:hypothetical protein [Alphaproteobacteria bacterium]MBL0718143.1 hypothetical protein [Alphaproteobacteria bacterium]